jgi:hypothetical protein
MTAYRAPPRLLDAWIEHRCQLLLQERLGDFCAPALDKQGPIPFEVSAEDVAQAGPIDADAIEESAGTCGQDDHPIRQIHRVVTPNSLQHEPKGDVVEGRQLRIERRLLENQGAPRPGRALKNYQGRPKIPDKAIGCACHQGVRAWAMHMTTTMNS